MTIKFATRKKLRSKDIMWMLGVAAELAVELLGLEDAVASKQIKFSLVNNQRSGVYGSCEAQWASDMAADLGLEPDKVRVRINEKMQLEASIKTIGHEMVHASQYVKGELTEGRMYKGKDYSGVSYEDRPWEIEASEFEQPFWDLFQERVAEKLGCKSEAEKLINYFSTRW